MLHNLLRHIWHLPRNIIAGVITGYQYTLSPDHGPLKGLYRYGYCRHEPTCSHYSKHVILEKGVLRGGAKALRRVLSCHPWAKISEEKWQKMASQR